MSLKHRTKTVALRALYRALHLAGVHHVFRWWNRRQVLIVMYHGVVPDGRDYYNWGQLPESKFVAQLDYLSRHYRLRPLDEIAMALRSGQQLPPYTAAITFDDGFANNASVAARHLRLRNLPATIFVVTDYIGSDMLLWPDELFVLMMQAEPQTIRLDSWNIPSLTLSANSLRWNSYVELLTWLKAMPAARKDEVMAHLRATIGPVKNGPLAEDFRAMTWEDVLKLHREGLIQFGGHTLTHEILTRLPPDDATHQMVESCRVLSQATQQERVPFAYPNGSKRDFNEFLQKVLRVQGASCAVTTIEGLNSDDQDLYQLKRISVGADGSPARFALKCSGFLPAVRGLFHPLRRWLRARRAKTRRPTFSTADVNWLSDVSERERTGSLSG